MIVYEGFNVENDGIYEISQYGYIGPDGNIVTEGESCELVISKKAFIEAFKQYILPNVCAEEPLPIGENIVHTVPLVWCEDYEPRKRATIWKSAERISWETVKDGSDNNG